MPREKESKRLLGYTILELPKSDNAEVQLAYIFAKRGDFLLAGIRTYMETYPGILHGTEVIEISPYKGNTWRARLQRKAIPDASYLLRL